MKERKEKLLITFEDKITKFNSIIYLFIFPKDILHFKVLLNKYFIHKYIEEFD